MNCKIWTQMAKAVFYFCNKAKISSGNWQLLEGSGSVSREPCGVHPVFQPTVAKQPGRPARCCRTPQGRMSEGNLKTQLEN